MKTMLVFLIYVIVNTETVVDNTTVIATETISSENTSEVVTTDTGVDSTPDVVIIGEVSEKPTTTTMDLNKCKLTHIGTEYIGKLSKTEANASCQYWSRANQNETEDILDEVFPDGSKSLAKNYCRNPNNDPGGPWCFTTKRDLIKDSCDVPLCKTTDCRLSGPGMEYAGMIKKSLSGRKCSKWTSSHYLRKMEKEKSFKSKFFPDDSVKQAKNYCRNPDGNIGGPWCYVETDKEDLHAIELCDIPFCMEIDPVMYDQGGDSGQYSFFTAFNATEDSFKIGIQLWNPKDWIRSRVYLLLSAVDVFASRSEIERWGSGVEIVLSRSGSGILVEEDELRETPRLLSGSKRTDVEVTWKRVETSSILIRVYEDGKKIVAAKISAERKILADNEFRFFSLSGTPALWNYSSGEEECNVHTTSQRNFSRFWRMRKAVSGTELRVFVRGAKEAVLMLRIAPMLNRSQLEIILGDKDKVKIIYHNKHGVHRSLKEVSWPKLLDFWRWEEFKISIHDDRLELHRIRPKSTELIADVKHKRISQMTWAGFASERVTYWTLYCDPKGSSDPPAPVPPECVSKQGDEHFNGTQSVTSEGHHCIPWIDDEAVPDTFQKNELYERFGGKTGSQNFCRNLNGDPKGPFCFIKDPASDLGSKLEYCYPRFCSSGDCKLAGTANDYVGHLNKTRSNRECKPWTEITDVKFVDVNNFPDPSLEEAGNFCRNPTKNVAGAWCYTTDPDVPDDFCYVKDCEKPLECTIVTSGYRPGRFYYILPSWRKYGLHFWLKTWNPDIYEGLIIKLVSLDDSQEYQLRIGDDDNEVLKFYYGDELLVHKTLPHLIPAGKWGGFWLRPGIGKVELGYHGVPNSFFEWTSRDEETSFQPTYISFGTIYNKWIGINLECSACLLEKTTIRGDDRIYPINLWNENPASNFTLYLRGLGTAVITLFSTPGSGDYISLQFDGSEPVISVVRDNIENKTEILGTYDTETTPLNENEWTEYRIGFTEKSLFVEKDDDQLLIWISKKPLLFYWFTISAINDYVIWSVNCPPADIDGEPRDGNWGAWGPWSCSVTCGKGVGLTQRLCDSPAPNVFGKECAGADHYEGLCNDFPCGEISPDTNDLIRNYLSSNHSSLSVTKGKKITLHCNLNIIQSVKKELHKLNVTWTHNGFPYSRSRSHMDEHFRLTITKTREKDSGVYLCVAYQDPESIPSKIVLDVVSLSVVATVPSKHVRKTRSLPLHCNGVALSYVYADLSQRWELNGTIWKDYGITTLQAVASDKVDNVTNSHAGVWTCVIIEEDFGFRWITDWFILEVKSAPSFWSHLMEDAATRPLFGKLRDEKNAMVLFFFLVAAIFGAAVGFAAFMLESLKRIGYDEEEFNIGRQ